MKKSCHFFHLPFFLFLLLILLLIASCQPKISDKKDIKTTTTTLKEELIYKLTDDSPPLGYIPGSIKGYTLVARKGIDDDSAQAVYEDSSKKYRFNLNITLVQDKEKAEKQAVKTPSLNYKQDSTTTVSNGISIYEGFNKKGVFFQGWATKFFYVVKIKTTSIDKKIKKSDLKVAAWDFRDIILLAIDEYEKSE